MQYFTIVAKSRNEKSRACAMIEAPDIEAASDRATRLLQGDHLAFVKKGSEYKIRLSSRRETSLLQSYLAACNGAQIETYLNEELNSLLWRRQSLLLSFFMHLYLAPELLRRKFAPVPAGSASSGSTATDSGGLTIKRGDSPEVAEKSETENSKDGISPNTTREHAETAEASVDASSHIETLDSIVSPEGPGTVPEHEIDLGDIF